MPNYFGTLLGASLLALSLAGIAEAEPVLSSGKSAPQPRVKISEVGSELLPEASGLGQYVWGRFFDMRYGELLVGDFHCQQPKNVQLRVNGLPVNSGTLAKYLGQLCVMRRSPANWAIDLIDIANPQLASADIFAIQVAAQGSCPADNSSILPTYKNGDELIISVKARSARKISLVIAGVAASLPAREIAPGRYEARWLVPKGLVLPNTFVSAIADYKGQKSSRLGASFALAGAEPLVVNYAPQGQCCSDAALVVVYEAPGTYAQPDSLRLFVDGKPVNEPYRATLNVLYYQPSTAFTTGLHRAEVRGRDQCGRVFKKNWNFTVVKD